MKPMAMVIKTYGDANITIPVANTFESAELKKLRAKVDVSAPVRSRQYKAMIRDARRKYRVKPLSPFQQRIWGYIGMLVLLMRGC